jgi:hypothetical protein
MIENNFEINQKENIITELGYVPLISGKYEDIKLIYEMGLPIPKTCILGVGFNKEKYNKWISQHQGEDFVIRTSRKPLSHKEFLARETYEKTGERSSSSNRDPGVSDMESDKIKDWVNYNQCVIVQALPKDSINHDCLSGICTVLPEANAYGLSWSISCHPDIASLTNRLGLSSWWKINLKNQEILNIKKPSGNKDFFLDAIRYRVGRSLLKEDGIRLPSLEKVEPQSHEWNQGVKYCQSNIYKLPEDHALVLLEERIKKEGLEELMPTSEDIDILKKLHPKLRKLYKYLNRLDVDYLPSNFSVKFSLLEYANRDKILLCWDIIRGT